MTAIPALPGRGVSKSSRAHRELMRCLTEAQSHRCCYCGVRFVKGWAAATKEHVRARAAGGANARTNLVAACSRCNHLRGSMNAYRFFELRLWERVTLAERARVDPDYVPHPAPRSATLAAVWPGVSV